MSATQKKMLYKDQTRATVMKTALGVLAVAALVGVFLLFILALNNRHSGTGTLGKLAYIQDGNLWVKTLPSGTAHRLTHDGAASRPAWSPSGKWLLYQHGPPPGPSDIGPRVIRADGSGERRLDAVGLAAWSPTADALALTLEGGTLLLEDADGSHERQLLPAVPGGGALDRRLNPAWSSDGQWIVFEEQHQNHQSAHGGYSYVGIRAVRSDGNDEHEIFSASVPPPDTNLGVDEMPARWAGYDGGAAAYLTLSPASSGPADAGGLPLNLMATLTRAEQGEGVRTLTYPDFRSLSPDGRQLATVAGVALVAYPPVTSSGTAALTSVPPPRDVQTNKSIVLLDTSTGALKRLTGPDLVAVSPSWSPDGRSIAYVARPDTGPVDITAPTAGAEASRRIWIMAADGADAHQLPTEGANCRQERPLWSADGTTLLFACVGSEPPATLWLVPAAGGKATQVAIDVSANSSQTSASIFAGYQGHIDWQFLYDWWRPHY